MHWSTDNWQTTHDSPTTDTQLGLHYVDLASDAVEPGGTLQFTFYWTDSDHWEGTNYAVAVEVAVAKEAKEKAVSDKKRRSAARPVPSV